MLTVCTGAHFRLRTTPCESIGDVGGDPVLAVGEVQSSNSAIETVQRQTMIGMLGCEFPDR